LNVTARDIFIGAQIDGIRQLRGRPADEGGAFDPIGLLLHHVGCSHLLEPDEWFHDEDNKGEHNACQARLMMTFDIGIPEWEQILRESMEGWDWLTIAWVHSLDHLRLMQLEEEDTGGTQ
jgi:hypothetical protein